PKEYSRFCNSVVPLARFPKLIYTNDEILSTPVEVANYGPHQIKNGKAGWQIKNSAGKILFKGKLDASNIPFGNGIKIGEIKTALASVTDPTQLLVEVTVDSYTNSWKIWVYPHQLPVIKNIYTTQVLDEK